MTFAFCQTSERESEPCLIGAKSISKCQSLQSFLTGALYYADYLIRDGLINAPLHESEEGANNQMHPHSPERIPWDKILHSVYPFGVTDR